jgi:Uma2 family endonuclease
MILPGISVPESRFLLHGVPWDAYVLLRDAPENYHVRMTYDRGTLEMMSPSRPHERFSKMIGRLIETWAEELDIPIQGCQTTTLRREDLEHGIEPDQCYYVEHEAQMRANTDLDLTKQPPPDLAVEVDLSGVASDKPSLYAALGVPELWRCDGRSLRVLRLGRKGRYVGTQASKALPGFPLVEAQRILQQLGTASDTALVKSFRQWVRSNASPDRT